MKPPIDPMTPIARDENGKTPGIQIIELRMNGDYDPEHQEGDLTLLKEQLTLLQVTACLLGAWFQTVGPLDNALTRINVETRENAMAILHAIDRFDDNFPCPDAWFHIWELVYVDENGLRHVTTCPVKTDSSWDSAESALMNPR